MVITENKTRSWDNHVLLPSMNTQFWKK